jgi:hypothetical protein
MTLNTTKLDSYVSKFRAGSPNIASAFDEVKVLLNQLDARIGTTPPPPTGARTPLPPVGPFRTEAGDHMFRDGDGLTTANLHVTSAPGYGIGNMRWPYAGASTGTWVLRDCKVQNVLSNGLGTDGAGFWIGERTQGERLEAWACGWMGMFTGAACKGSRFTDVNIHDNPLIGLYMEHVTTDVEFKRSSFGSAGGTSSSINVEWWYADTVYGPTLPYNGKAGSFDCRFIDCDIYCPASNDYRVAGAFLDGGTFGFLFQNCRFWGPGKSVGLPNKRVDMSKPNLVVDCVFENTGGGPYTHDNGIG